MYGRRPTTVWSAPGRVNLIGEHTDYNDGFVLPFALSQRTAVAVAPSSSSDWTVRSEAQRLPVTFGASDLKPGVVAGWAGYVAGVVAVLRDEGITVPPADMAICSEVPVGAGLSSSAALECATLAALLELSGATVPVDQWPRLAQRAENIYAGVPCGVLDQSASTLCRSGHALFLDCRDQSTEQVPFALAEAGLAMLIIDTRAPHRNADGEYAARRQSCEAAAATLGVPALRDVTDLDAALKLLPDAVQRIRTRHIVTENQRVLATVELLRQGRFTDIGPLLTASHASMRDDFEISVDELDTAVEAAVAAGAYGARMTGGGFGGCIIALVDADAAPAVAEAVEAAFTAKGFGAPDWFVASPAAGVARVSGG
jgi:galactokinase